MLPAVIAYPQIDPVAISLGPIPIRWYALAYIAGLLLGWAYARKLVRDDRLWGALPRPDVLSLDDLCGAGRRGGRAPRLCAVL